jgi:hypothetical protein
LLRTGDHVTHPFPISRAVEKAVASAYTPIPQGFTFLHMLTLLTKGTPMDPARLVGYVFTGTSLVLLSIMLLLMVQDRQIARASWAVTGTVISQVYDTEGAAAPVITYSLHGQPQSFQGPVWSSPPSFGIGEHVELLIHAQDPNTVLINSFAERYFWVILLGFFTVALGGVGTLLLVFIKK